MKNSLKYLLLFVLPLGVVLLVSCVSTDEYNAYNVVKKPRIFMTANPGLGKLNIHTAGSKKCMQYIGKDENGCVVADKGESALLSFAFNGSPDWKFTEITICKGQSKPAAPCNLDVWERREFEAYDGSKDSPRYTPDSNGVIKLPEGSDAMSVVYLLDHNLADQDYFYSVKACHPTLDCADTDPPLINRGRY